MNRNAIGTEPERLSPLLIINMDYNLDVRFWLLYDRVANENRMDEDGNE